MRRKQTAPSYHVMMRLAAKPCSALPSRIVGRNSKIRSQYKYEHDYDDEYLYECECKELEISMSASVTMS